MSRPWGINFLKPIASFTFKATLLPHPQGNGQGLPVLPNPGDLPDTARTKQTRTLLQGSVASPQVYDYYMHQGGCLDISIFAVWELQDNIIPAWVRSDLSHRKASWNDDSYWNSYYSSQSSKKRKGNPLPCYWKTDWMARLGERSLTQWLEIELVSIICDRRGLGGQPGIPFWLAPDQLIVIDKKLLKLALSTAFTSTQPCLFEPTLPAPLWLTLNTYSNLCRRELNRDLLLQKLRTRPFPPPPPPPLASTTWKIAPMEVKLIEVTEVAFLTRSEGRNIVNE